MRGNGTGTKTQQALVYGVPFGICMAVAAWFEQPRPSLAAVLVRGVLEGVFFAFFMVLATRRMNRRLQAVTGALAPEIETAALRALVRGPVPADPAVRVAALTLGRHRLAKKQRWPAVVFVCVAAVLVALAVTQRGSSAFDVFMLVESALLLVLAIALAVAHPRRLRRRVALLEAHQHDQS